VIQGYNPGGHRYTYSAGGYRDTVQEDRWMQNIGIQGFNSVV